MGSFVATPLVMTKFTNYDYHGSTEKNISDDNSQIEEEFWLLKWIGILICSDIWWILI